MKKIKELRQKLESNDFNKDRMKYGVYCYHPWAGMGETPWRNFQGGKLPPEELTKKIYPEAFLEYKKSSKTCDNCPIRCWSVHEFYEGDSRFISEAMRCSF